MQTWTKPYMQIFQEFITSIDLSDVDNLQVDHDLHRLLASPISQSENVCTQPTSRHSSLEDYSGIVYSKLNSRVCLSNCVCCVCARVCTFGLCLYVCVFVILRPVFHLWCWLSSSNSCSCDLERAVKQTREKNEWEKSVVKNKKEVQKCTEMKRKDSSVSVHVLQPLQLIVVRPSSTFCLPHCTVHS